MSSSHKINPQLSVVNQKNELKKLQSNVDTMRNRIELLRQQLQKQKDGVKKNKQLTKQAIEKKIQVNRINQYKQKDSSDHDDYIENLRNKNRELRMSHGKELQDIQKAIYLVKLDDAREVKNISMQHEMKRKEMNNQFLSMQQQKRKRISMESEQAKERYMKYWKQKLAQVYTEQANTIVKVSKQKQENKQELSKLEEEEIRLMEQINQHHSKGVQTKKQYLAALSLPVKDVAEAMGHSKLDTRRNKTINNSSLAIENQKEKHRYHMNSIDKSGIKMPNANVNESKLKLILNQLKKVEKNRASTYSQR